MSKFKEAYKKLNEKQKEAVDSIYGPIMVVAGPGTGKTQIIGARTANIILNAKVNPENILISTFTEAGVIAIKNRLLSFIGPSAYKVNVSTIHSFAQDVISTFPEKFAEYNAVTAIDEIDQIEIIKGILDDFISQGKIEFLKATGNDYFYLKDIIFRIGILKNEGISLEKLKISIDKQVQIYDDELSEIKPSLKKHETTKETHEKNIGKLNELSLIFEEYNKLLRLKGLYDFNDMINFVVEKFKVDDELKYHYAEQFQFIMLDEFQDTNNAQNQIIDSIMSVSDDPNIMVVGDDDQSIYRFQGANIENMLGFSHKYKDTKFVVLDTNYRSNQEILDLSDSLISYNEERISKRVSSINKQLIAGNNSIKNKTPEFIIAKSDIVEKDFVLKKINELKEQTPLENMAVIVRGNKEVKAWSDFLMANDIPVESKMKSNILESDYVNFIISYLRVLNSPFNYESKLIDILLSNLVSVDNLDVLKINNALYELNYKLKNKVSLFSFLSDENLDKKVDITDFDSIKNFISTFKKLQNELSVRNISLFLHAFFDKTGVISEIEKNADFDEIQDVYTFFNFTKKLNQNNKELNLSGLLRKIDLYIENGVQIPRQILRTQSSGVNILTGHSSKGLEFHTVFIPGLYEGNWNSKKKIDKLKLPSALVGDGILGKKGNQIEEDRRLFFVALTRAQENLFISMPQSIENSMKIKSSFMAETEGNYNLLNYENPNINDEVISLLSMQNSDFGEKELLYIEEFLKNYKLSPSDFNTFKESPLEFLQKTVFRYPFTENIFTIFGSVYHKTLENFYINYKNSGSFNSKESLLENFENLLKKELLTPDEYNELLDKGKEGLAGYYEIAKNNSREILNLEYNFRPRNIEFNGIPMTGKIDKIERDEYGNLVLVDYKTGSPKSLKQIKGLNKNSDDKYFKQLLFYKKMLELDSNFGDDKILLAIDFCAGKGGKYSYLELEYSDEEMDEFEKELQEIWSNISSIDFWRDFLNKKTS